MWSTYPLNYKRSGGVGTEMRCVVIDDEPLAINVIKSFIDQIPFLELKATFTNPFRGWEYLREHFVDLVFLDINMPGLSGLQLAEVIANGDTRIIFTTAYSEYALEGFNLDATDYLLKPIDYGRFLKAVNKARRDRGAYIASPAPAQAAGAEYLLVKTEHRIVKLEHHRIHFVEGYKDYVKIHTDEDQPLLTLKSLKSLEEALEPSGFVRIHKSFLISISKIQEIRGGRVKIKDRFLNVSDTFRDNFRRRVVHGRL